LAARFQVAWVSAASNTAMSACSGMRYHSGRMCTPEQNKKIVLECVDAFNRGVPLE
jgi:hypothetical protein